ncbi:MAG: hypothetical protein R3C56_35490 [Pirellulaceae bacterium]
MNRDRNVMFAAEQTDRADQVTSQVANYAQPATAAPAGLPAAGQVASPTRRAQLLLPRSRVGNAAVAQQRRPGTAVASGHFSARINRTLSPLPSKLLEIKSLPPPGLAS